MIINKFETNRDENRTELFITQDLNLATCLISLDYELRSIDKTNPQKNQFLFQRYPGLEIAIEHYWNDNLKINARTLFDNQRLLKNRIYAAE